MTQNTLRKVYDPVGRCIYCGSTKYAPDSARFLATEHIIPEGISGGLELPQASCRRCERAINPWETKLLRGMLLGSRTYLKLETKRPKDRPGALPLFDTSVTPNRKMMVAIADYPISVLLTAYDAPSVLTGLPMKMEETVWCRFLTEIDSPLLARKYGLHEFATSSLDAKALCVTLAKIAHAYIAAELGINNFIPLLPHFIIGDFFGWRRYYIGGHLNPPAPNPDADLHEIGLEEQINENWDYHVVRLRLFANLGAPIYRIVAGRRLNSTTPEATLLEATDAQHSEYRNPAVEPINCPIPTGLWDQPSPSSNAAPARGLRRFVRVEGKPRSS